MGKHLCLIHTPMDAKYKDASTHYYAPPLGLIALTNYVAEKCPDTRVSVLDGDIVHTMGDILAFIEKEKPDIVGQSVQLISYEYALEIAGCARDIGAVNILGGHHASQLAETIAIRREGLVDFVVHGDGEEAVAGLLNDEPPEEIPNLFFSKNGKVFRTEKSFFDIRRAPVLDYSMIDKTPYQSSLKNSDFGELGDMTLDYYARTYSHKGCGNRGKSVGCVFCGRADQGVRFKEPAQFWKDIEMIVENDANNYVFDVGDDFLYDENWLSAVLAEKPDFEFPVRLSVFGRANRVTQNSAKLLSKLGVSEVIIGFESGDEEVLRRCNKRDTSPDTNVNAARLLFENGMDVFGAFVLALPGETGKSLENTIDCARKITDASYEITGHPMRAMSAGLIEPHPGSTAFRTVAKAFPKKYHLNDRISLEELQRDYFRVYFGLESERAYKDFRSVLAQAATEILSLAKIKEGQGWLDDEGCLADQFCRARIPKKEGGS